MAKYVILYNPLSHGQSGKSEAEKISSFLKENETELVGVTDIRDYRVFFAERNPSDRYVLTGGDGTLNRFINRMAEEHAPMPENIFYFPTGSGNDFYRDINDGTLNPPIRMNRYLEKLPEIEYGTGKKLFLNGVGFGIDGYVCNELERITSQTNKSAGYTSLAVKGLLGAYKPKKARITVDGKTFERDNVWLAPTMNGRYFGSGMMPAPNQDRLNPGRTLTLMVFSHRSALITLLSFPKLFKGTHTGLRNCEIYEGKDITVEFDEPCALQIDGEPVPGITKYRCTAGLPYSETGDSIR